MERIVDFGVLVGTRLERSIFFLLYLFYPDTHSAYADATTVTDIVHCFVEPSLICSAAHPDFDIKFFLLKYPAFQLYQESALDRWR